MEHINNPSSGSICPPLPPSLPPPPPPPRLTYTRITLNRGHSLLIILFYFFDHHRSLVSGTITNRCISLIVANMHKNNNLPEWLPYLSVRWAPCYANNANNALAIEHPSVTTTHYHVLGQYWTVECCMHYPYTLLFTLYFNGSSAIITSAIITSALCHMNSIDWRVQNSTPFNPVGLHYCFVFLQSIV